MWFKGGPPPSIPNKVLKHIHILLQQRSILYDMVFVEVRTTITVTVTATVKPPLDMDTIGSTVTLI